MFAAGQDRRVRAWSLRTGEPVALRAKVGVEAARPARLAETVFPDIVRTLQVTEEGGTKLWATAGRRLYEVRW